MRSVATAVALGLGLACALAGAAVPAARADNAMLTFAEMLELQKLPLEPQSRALSEEELILYQNMEFYVFTVFEALHAANNTALALHREPLFCAPAGAFRFRGENEIVTMAAVSARISCRWPRKSARAPPATTTRPRSRCCCSAYAPPSLPRTAPTRGAPWCWTASKRPARRFDRRLRAPYPRLVPLLQSA